MKYLLLILVITISSQTGSCQRKAWKKTVEKNTISAYQGFLEDHPKSKFSQEAKSKLAQLKYLLVSESKYNAVKNTAYIDSLKLFLTEYPSYYDSVKVQLDHLLRMKADFPNRVYLEKIHSYKIDSTTEESFLSDGWNPFDPYDLVYGLTEFAIDTLQFVSRYVIGVKSDYDRNWEKSQFMIDSFLSKMWTPKGGRRNGGWLGHILSPDDYLKRRRFAEEHLCLLIFKDGLLKIVEFNPEHELQK